MPLVDHIKSFIRAKRLFQSGDTVLIGISGGADSIALALILNECKHEFGIRIHLAHFNHKLRPEAETEEVFVHSFAQQLNLSCVFGKPSEDLKTYPGSLEDNAREARLNFLVAAAKNSDVSASKIALAHHKDDLAETVLMRILRGSGLQGMQAIRPSRTLKGMMFIRPLLCIDRREIEEFLKSKGQDFCHDATNDQLDFSRNRLRHELLPLLKRDYNPNISSVLSNLSETLSGDYDHLEDLAREAMAQVLVKRSADQLTLSLDGLQRQPVALQRLILRLAVQELNGHLNQIDFSHWMEAEDLLFNRPDQSAVHWPASIQIQKCKPHLILSSTKA